MKVFIGLLLLITAYPGDPPAAISNYRDHNSLILIFSKSNRDPDYESSLRLLAADPLGMARRDILIFEIFTAGGINPDGQPLSDDEIRQIRQFYNVPFEEYRTILIDRTGRKIHESADPLPAREVIEIFDNPR